MLNRLVIMGRIVRDPKMNTTQSGTPVCNFTVAVERDFAVRGERETDFIDVVAWRQTAEFIEKYFSKGRMIYVDGKLQSRRWEDDRGNKRISWELQADQVGFCGDKAAQQAEAPQDHVPDEEPMPRRGADFGAAVEDADHVPF